MSDGNTEVPWFARKAKPACEGTTFRDLLDRSRGLTREAFAARFPHPVLVSAVSFDPSTWARALVLPVRRSGTAQLDPATPETVLVGRGEDVDLRLPSAAVSRHHARFERREGAWWLKDEGSSNGTRLNGFPLKQGQAARIVRSPASVELGNHVRFLFFVPETLWDLLAEARRREISALQRRPAPSRFPSPTTDAGPASTPESETTVDGDLADTLEGALSALEAVGDLVRSVEARLEDKPEAVEVYARGGAVGLDAAIEGLRTLGDRVLRVRVRLGVGEKMPITLYSALEKPPAPLSRETSRETRRARSGASRR